MQQYHGIVGYSSVYWDTISSRDDLLKLILS